MDSPALDVAFDDAPGPVGWGDGGVREGRRRRGSGASKAKDRVDKASKGGADDMNGRADKSTDAMPVRRGQLRRGMTVRELGSLVGWAMGRVVEVAGGMGEAVMGEEDPLSLECQELVMLEAGVEVRKLPGCVWVWVCDDGRVGDAGRGVGMSECVFLHRSRTSHSPQPPPDPLTPHLHPSPLTPRTPPSPPSPSPPSPTPPPRIPARPSSP